MTMTRTRTALVLGLLTVTAWTFKTLPAAAQEGLALPAPVLNLPDTGDSAVLVLAGGCFWGVQGVFQHVKGVTSAVSGYAGGDQRTAKYDLVSSDATGHAEAVAVTYDPRQVSYGRLLQIFFSVAHDPTEVNRQGPDTGRQYRSAIFPSSDGQAAVAKAYIAQLNQSRTFKRAIATTLEMGHAFYAAEAYHQDFLTKNPTYSYIVVNDLPKIDNLKRLFADRFRVAPVLVSSRD